MCTRRAKYEEHWSENFPIQKVPVCVPVTTRAVGFYTQYLFTKVYQLNRRDRIPECSPYAFYRVALAQFEYRLLKSMSAGIYTDNRFYRPKLTMDERDIIRSMTTNIPVIANMIADVGCFKYKNTTFGVSCPKDPVLGILYSNLRSTVESMADPATPKAERDAFYALNPLPFAAWNKTSPVLLNSADFMWEGYETEDFERDIYQVRNFLSIKNTNTETIYYEDPGHRSILVSNSSEGLRNPDRIYCDDQWGNEMFPTGNVDSFWSPENISPQDFSRGHHLVGERRSDVGDVFLFRSPDIAKVRGHYNWKAKVITNDFNFFGKWW